jgi:hypothetical protein
MKYTGVMHKLFGTDEVVYEGSILKDAELKHNYSIFPLQDPTVATGGSEFSSIFTNMNSEDMAFDSRNYVITFNPPGRSQKTISVYVHAAARKPLEVGKERRVMVRERTDRFFGARDQSYELIATDGEWMPVSDWDIIE